MDNLSFLEIAEDLELAGLIWKPEIGDEIAERARKSVISILVDPQGLTPDELRAVYLWLPTVEQMVVQFEARQAILCHAGLELSDHSIAYRTVIKAPVGQFECQAASLRSSMGMALRNLLLSAAPINVN